LFKFFVIFSMNFAWIGNVFGFYGSKKDAYSSKRISKSIFKSNAVKNIAQTQVFKFKTTDYTDLAKTTAVLLNNKLAVVTCKANNYYPNHTGTGGVIKEILFPHHGFW
jgi:hypothetical protein